MNKNNSLIVVSFKNVKGKIIKQMSFNKNVNFNIGMIPEVATSYYIYSKKNNGVYSEDFSCQIGRPLGFAVDQNKENKILFTILSNTLCECVYLMVDNKEYVVPIDMNMKLVNNFEEFVSSFKNDLEDVKTDKKQLVKKM